MVTLKRGRTMLVLLACIALLCVPLTGCSKGGSPGAVSAAPTAVEPASEPEPAPQTQTVLAEARSFSDGIAWVRRDKESAWEAVDASGTTLFTLGEGQGPLTDFIDGSAAVITDAQKVIDKPVEIVGKDGAVLFPQAGDENEYQFRGSSLGKTFVKRTISSVKGTGDQCGIVGSNGEWIVEPAPNLWPVKDVGHGIWEVQSDIGNTFFETAYKKGCNYFDANNNGFFGSWEYVNDPKLKILAAREIGYYYQEGLAYVAKGNYPGYASLAELGFKAGKNGFYDKKKNLVIDIAKYAARGNAVGGFKDGYCSLLLENPQQDTFATIIDKTGKQMFEPVAAMSIGAYSHGLAPLTKAEGNVAYIDSSGTEVVTGLYSAEPFADNGLGLVQMSSDASSDGFSVTQGYRFIDANGNTAF